MTFDLFIQNYEDADTPEGDFARDWSQDSSKPTVETWEGLNDYLKGRRACPEVIELAESLFRYWK